METFWTIVLVLAFIGFGIYRAAMQEQAPPNPQIVCPHCGTRGNVKTTRVVRKQGVSGGKATGAVLTGGVSLLATGLSRKQTMTNMRCGNCHVSWDVA
jgi:DNA-directed RNA polymerase subunit RPC12/RpoP